MSRRVERSLGPQPFAQPGFWCERITYRSLSADAITSVATYATTNPAQAIRKIRVDVRLLVSALPPREMARAFGWIDGGGCLGAVAALHRGEPCGFSLNTRDAWVEWTVRPVVFLTSAAAGPVASCRDTGGAAPPPSGFRSGCVSL
ncbi:hypothetical protein [Streptomyces ipomoeae]|uniref:Uncharacterized protein n=1 Tax=Streptomyces ipomoeae 91-03 TaxID=698759 RepID=L1L6Z3_9ACTN|nr:hypothetical protein [Streptomyces ipomoeae]EKX68687.1 hypothetical protein STRIP9103_05624 [Streptomyces ipomoeae 91-03]MDX2699248.1 hypothetical protein [Streptomyces ipomoeae]MDX2844779.1 hypothetical protein [Streptomyces ipomoeae]MDX2935687.1 hypothetical protein [Streptomyces ipomoeae]TQE15507.1 hypothetical protein SipoB123_43705 [Streptomyces ipomoeae]